MRPRCPPQERAWAAGDAALRGGFEVCGKQRKKSLERCGLCQKLVVKLSKITNEYNVSECFFFLRAIN